jgi:hypothetical protein
MRLVSNPARFVAVTGALVLIATASAASAKCMRPGMSDVAFGKDAAIKSAHEKLIPYAEKIARQRGWRQTTNLRRTNMKTVSCEVYLDLGLLGTEYRCLVRATFCER